MLKIEKAAYADLPEILRLQKTSFMDEARLLNNFEIQPLLQTLPEIEAEFANGVILKATAPNTLIVGSVRGYVTEGVLHAGKLMVHPAYRRRGLGARLLLAVETHCTGFMCCQLFTSALSENNLKLYAKLGYREFARKASGQGFDMVYMQKVK